MLYVSFADTYVIEVILYIIMCFLPYSQYKYIKGDQEASRAADFLQILLNFSRTPEWKLPSERISPAQCFFHLHFQTLSSNQKSHMKAYLQNWLIF